MMNGHQPFSTKNLNKFQHTHPTLMYVWRRHRWFLKDQAVILSNKIRTWHQWDYHNYRVHHHKLIFLICHLKISKFALELLIRIRSIVSIWWELLQSSIENIELFLGQSFLEAYSKLTICYGGPCTVSFGTPSEFHRFILRFLVWQGRAFVSFLILPNEPQYVAIRHMILISVVSILRKILWNWNYSIEFFQTVIFFQNDENTPESISP